MWAEVARMGAARAKAVAAWRAVAVCEQPQLRAWLAASASSSSDRRSST